MSWLIAKVLQLAQTFAEGSAVALPRNFHFTEASVLPHTLPDRSLSLFGCR